jgi:uncharacterized protein (TIGR03437 family)
VVVAAAFLSQAVIGQAPTPITPDWRHIGNAAIERGLAGLATGPVDRAWYSQDGSQLYIRTASGKVWATADFESWKPAEQAANEPVSRFNPARLPEPGARIRTQPAAVFGSVYAFGKNAWRSSDGGASWNNLTGFRDSSLLGTGLTDLAVSPRNEEEIVVVGANGVFRSADGGKSWSGINQGLPNLQGTRLLGLPGSGRGTTLGLADGQAVEWQAGEKQAWRPTDNSSFANDAMVRQVLSSQYGARVTAYGTGGSYLYAGLADGRLLSSSDGNGRTPITHMQSQVGDLEAIWVDQQDPRIAIAVYGVRTRDQAWPSAATHVLRTLNGGSAWDDLTANLPDVGVHGVTADRSSGAIYIATDRGVFLTYLDQAGSNSQWTALTGLPPARVRDVKLDPGGNQLWAAVEGYGVYATLAPHRLRDPRVVSTADLVARAVAPGALVSVLGARVQSARSGDLQVPVLDATDSESQIQIPFEASGTSFSLDMAASAGRRMIAPLTLGSAAPAIFVDRDGTPMLLDADSGVLLDSMQPAHVNTRIQIVATGLGKVTPDWPTGLAAPIENPPKVAGSVKVYLDRSPVEVTRAVLAPGHIGFYLIELEIPKIVNYGAAELYMEVDGQASNRVRVFIEP